MEVVLHDRAQAGPEGTSKLHQEVAQMPMALLLPSLSLPAPMASWGVPYNQLTEKEKTWAWLKDGSAWCAGTTRKRPVAALKPLSGTPLRVIKGNPPSGQTLASKFFLCFEGEMARRVIIFWFMSCGPWFGRVIRNLEEPWLENWWQVNLGKSTWINLSKWTNNCEDICVPCEYSAKGDLSRGGF